MHPFEQLIVWEDPYSRSAAANMAVDQLVLSGLHEAAVLRFYHWNEPAVTFGYFDELEVAKEKFGEEDLTYVRRWTGGGVVDHRVDLTYTLAIPRDHLLAKLRGAESYRVIHEAVVTALRDCGVEAKVIAADSGNESAACFENPVAYDVVDGQGNKLAGAGQRRTRWGLLHQGSVQGLNDSPDWRAALVKSLTARVNNHVIEVPGSDEVDLLVAERYGTEEWLTKR